LWIIGVLLILDDTEVRAKTVRGFSGEATLRGCLFALFFAFYFMTLYFSFA